MSDNTITEVGIILHGLRNPYGATDAHLKAVRLSAANYIEAYCHRIKELEAALSLAEALLRHEREKNLRAEKSKDIQRQRELKLIWKETP